MRGIVVFAAAALALAQLSCGSSVAQAPSIASGVFVVLTIQGSGTVSSSTAGLSCTGPLTCDGTSIAAEPGGVVDLVAQPAPKMKFAGWTSSAATAHYEEQVDPSGAPDTTGSPDAKCTTDYATSGLGTANVTSADLRLPSGAQLVPATSVQCKTPSQAPAPARAIKVPFAYLLTATFAPQ
jgi:hypothetical protein